MMYAFGLIYTNLKVRYIEIIGNLRIDGNGDTTLQSATIHICKALEEDACLDCCTCFKLELLWKTVFIASI